MWRAILIGKLVISTLGSLIVGGICLSQPWREEYTFFQSSKWIGTGVFFAILALVQIWVIYLFAKKK